VDKIKKEVHLITGGAGFIGSNLIKHLISEEKYIICLDNFLTSSNNNIKKWINYPNFRLINKSVIEELEIDVNYIWHLACPPSPKFYYKDPISTSKIIFEGTFKLLKLAKANKASFLFASSSEIYGKSLSLPLSEDCYGQVNTLNKRSCYSEGKRLAETLCYDFGRMYDLDIKIARIFNTYGPNMSNNDGRVINTFILNGLRNEDLHVHGLGEQTRSFCYIDDLVNGLINLMYSSFNGAFNLGNSDEISILNLAKTILHKLDSKSKIVFIEADEDEPNRRKPSLRKVKKYLNWEPTTNLNDGLEKTIKYFNEFSHFQKNIY
tara:strand:+ start:116 stop:1078 length:963 start_codon:yes stop_codon:yes gene_type:complete